MKKFVVLLFIISLILAGCNKKETEEHLPKILNVELQVSPKSAAVQEIVTFQAKVTYGNEIVTDADDVSFEIWRDNQEESTTYKATHSKNGLYVLEKRFDKEGRYYVYAHVTAKSMHTMPKEEFSIGNVTLQEK